LLHQCAAPKRFLGIGAAPGPSHHQQPTGHRKSPNPGSFAARGSIVREKDTAAHKTRAVETLIYSPSRAARSLQGSGNCYIYPAVGVWELPALRGSQRSERLEAIDVQRLILYFNPLTL
jgi:hypothetical protein